MSLKLLNIKLFFCLLFSSYLSGQTFTVYNYFNSPLPDNRVNCVELDQEENLWVGTQYGLVVYDGFVWTNLSDSVPSPVIKDISVNVNGDVWIATNSGFCKYDSVWSFFAPPQQALSEQINCISFDGDGDPWFGTVNGLFSFKNGVFNLVLDTSSLENFINVSSIVFKGDSVVVGTMNGGIGFIYNGACSWFNISPIGGIIDNSFNDLLVDKYNNIWGCSPYGGLQVLFSDNNWFFINNISSPGWQSNSITSIDEDSTERKCLGTKGGGVVLFDFGTGVSNTTVIDSSNSDLPDDFILDVLFQNEILWVATQFEGLVKVSSFLSSVFEKNKKENFFPSPFKSKINVCSDGPGTLFVYNIMGEKVFEGFVFGLKEIDLGFLSKGVYVFSIKTKNKKTSKKIYKL